MPAAVGDCQLQREWLPSGIRHTGTRLVWPTLLLILVLTVLARTGRTVSAARALPSLSAPHRPDEVLIKWQNVSAPVSPTRLDERRHLREALHARVLDTVPPLGIERWQIPYGSLGPALRLLASSPAVAWVEPNYLMFLPDTPPLRVSPLLEVQGFFFPNDPYYARYSQYYLKRLGVESAWNTTIGDRRIIVAIVDTGVDCEHEDLQGHCWTNDDEVAGNGVDDDGNGYVDDRTGWNFFLERPAQGDVHYHGTHVAGIVAASINNGKGIVGIAPGVTLMPLGVFSPEGVGTYYDLIRAIVYAVDNGARVINMSLGATTYSRGEAEAVAYAVRHGAVLVAAAGNRSSNRVFYPAAHPQVIAVAATDVSDYPAGFSNHGDYISVAAPGVSIISTIPGNGYGVLSGTSMATPHVSGLAALILSLNPELSPNQVRALIEEHADDRVGPPALDTPGRDPYYGAGRIHVGRAVAATTPAPYTPPPPSGEAPTLPWTPPCSDVVVNGGFEAGTAGWTVQSARVVSDPVYQGARSLRLDSDQAARASQVITIPENTLRATFFAALRIESADSGDGPSPDFPFDDWLRVRLVSEDGRGETLLLRAGNTSDSVRYGLEWDEVVAVLPAGALPVRGGNARLVFETGSDGDALTTTFTVDEVRLCLVQGRVQYRFAYMPP